MEDIEIFRKFKFLRLLDEDTGHKTINLLGMIDSQHAVIVAEKTAFNTSPTVLSMFQDPSNFSAITTLGQNEIYRWYLASSSGADSNNHPEVKFRLIYPATEAHIRKFSKQNRRMVTETRETYEKFVKRYISDKRIAGTLNWVYNILEHKEEKEIIIFEDPDPREGFILLPDFKWDRRTISALYTIAIVHRRDISSLRDLKKKDAPWLRRLSDKMTSAICEAYPQLEDDQIKFYVHYHPSYYHFHIHAVSISHDGGLGQTAGKAFLLGNIISQLEGMHDDENSFADVELTFMVGEESELWQTIFAGLRAK